MKRKMITLTLGLFCLLKVEAQTVIDLSTGRNSGGPIAYGTNDDTWVQVTNYLGATAVPKVCHSTVWIDDPGGARWITPKISPANIESPLAIDGGNYIYEMSFVASPLCVSSAVMHFNAIGGDNTITEIKVNTTAHTLSIPMGPLVAFNLTLAQNEIIPGATNTITVTVYNNSSTSSPHTTITGLVINGDLTIDYGDLQPTLTGNTTFCSGDPLSFTGNDGPGTAMNTFWGIAEWDNVNNVDVVSGYTWTQWYPGTPGNFTFPVNPPCNKYYHVKVAVGNSCSVWEEANLIIRINCPPTANAGPDITVCEGVCTDIGVFSVPKFRNFTWTAGGSTVGSTSVINVCPTTTTTYTQTVTSTQTGCASSDQMTVTVIPNIVPGVTCPTPVCYGNPITATGSDGPGTSSDYYWELTEWNTVTNAPASGGYTWSQWNSGTPGFFSFPGSASLSCNKYYMVKLAIGNSCIPWIATQQLVFFSCCNPGMMTYDPALDDHVQLKNLPFSPVNVDELSVNIYPNPSTGLFTIETAEASGKIQVFDMMGKNIRTIELNGSTQYTLDLSGSSKGIYTVNVMTGNQNRSQKIVLE